MDSQSDTAVNIVNDTTVNGTVVNGTAVNEDVKNPDTTQAYFKVEYDDCSKSSCVRLLDPKLIEIIEEHLQIEEAYDEEPRIPAYELFSILPILKNTVGKSSNQENGSENGTKNLLESLVNWIEKEYESSIYKIKNMIDKNVISFKNLFYLFPKGQDICAEWNERKVGAKVIEAIYNKDNWGTKQMNIKAEVIDSDGEVFYRGTRTFTIYEWDGTCNIEELSVAPLSTSLRDELVERGRKFAKYAIGPQYLHYTGTLFRRSWCGNIHYKSVGRLMVDIATFFKMNPNSPRTYRNPKSTLKSVKEEDLFMCAPTVCGFSFASKRWGQLFIDALHEIKFDDESFDQLVMDPIKKEVVASLVTSEHKGMDLISGKGGGCIFLLHGPPGVGKTLTAEAISESLHRPLYAVSVGELGTTAVELEKKLNEILEVASVWNAVILIDEADIFLERRSEFDVQRNALVSIFLRLLEYHQGILFLTTNRVKCFDPAFQSRISVSLKYNDLDSNARAQVWRTFLDRAEGKDKSQVDIESLKDRNLNGREIKTAVRLAKALTIKNNPNGLITNEQLETILDLSKSFSEEISAIN